MARAKKIYVKGDKEIINYLKNLENEVENILSDAVKDGAAVVYDDARANVPVDTGNLKNSIEMKEGKKTKKKAIWNVKVNLKKAFYGKHVEFGDKKRRARPFLRRAVDKNKERIANKIIESLKRAIKRVR